MPVNADPWSILCALQMARNSIANMYRSYLILLMCSLDPIHVERIIVVLVAHLSTFWAGKKKESVELTFEYIRNP
jgi:hypothetical protein